MKVLALLLVCIALAAASNSTDPIDAGAEEKVLHEAAAKLQHRNESGTEDFKEVAACIYWDIDIKYKSDDCKVGENQLTRKKVPIGNAIFFLDHLKDWQKIAPSGKLQVNLFTHIEAITSDKPKSDEKIVLPVMMCVSLEEALEFLEKLKNQCQIYIRTGSAQWV